jgi:D-alanine-D-alanine ligase
MRAQRRGQRKYQLVVEGPPQRVGQQQKTPDVVGWCIDSLYKLINLSSQKDRLAVAVLDMKTESYRVTLPHRAVVTLVLSYLDPKLADAIEEKIPEILGKKGARWTLEKISDRPPMPKRRGNIQLARTLEAVAQKWDIPIALESSVVPSVGGLVPARVPVLCGLGPVAKSRYTSQEAVNRISIIQRTLLLAEFLVEELSKD